MNTSSEADLKGALMHHAYEQLNAGQLEDAVDTFSSAIAASRDAEAFRGRGLARIQLKQWVLAAQDFSSAREMDPHEPENWVDLGVCLAMEHQIYEAIDVFESLLKHSPGHVRAYVELGLLHLRVGAIPKGRWRLQQALVLEPTLAQRRLIETVLQEQEQLDKKRFYRPDFEALHRAPKQRIVSQFWTTLRQLVKPDSAGTSTRRQTHENRHVS